MSRQVDNINLFNRVKVLCKSFVIPLIADLFWMFTKEMRLAACGHVIAQQEHLCCAPKVSHVDGLITGVLTLVDYALLFA